MLYYRHHIGDYLRDTAHLTLLEHGAYRILLDLYYQHSGSLPSSDEQICRIARCRNNGERNAVIRILREFFSLQSDGYHHKRCDSEIAAIKAKSEKARTKARKRWDATALPQQSQGNASRYPLTNKDLDLTVSETKSAKGNGKGQLPELMPQVKTVDPPDIERNRAMAAALAAGNVEQAQRIKNGAPI